MSSFTDQIAVVTGASSGIGRAIALDLAGRGLSVCLLGRRLEVLNDVASKITSTPKDVKIYHTDLTSDEDIYRLAEHLRHDIKHIDILVHSAGEFSMGAIENASVNDLDKQYRVNVRAPYLLTQVLLPMIKSRKGQIVFINSSSGLRAKAEVSQYAATKHALKAVADSLREEVNKDGIRVLSVFPGRTATKMQERVHQLEGKAYDPGQYMKPEDVAAVVVNALSLPRSAEVTDITLRPLKKPG